MPASAAPDDADGKALGMSVPPPDSVNGSPPAGGAKAGSEESVDSFALRADHLAPGKQQVRLAVEVKAPEFLNLEKEDTIRLVVTNQGSNDVHGVILTYQLPESLEFLRSDSKEEHRTHPSSPHTYTWNKPMLAANGEWSVAFRVKAKDTRACEHLASVTAKAGTKERTIVREPKLHVEADLRPGRVQKGEQVSCQVSVSNPGTGPATNVVITAEFSSGLRLRETTENQVEQVIPLIKPGETIPLDPLLIDTVDGGKQTLTVNVQSPDVIPVDPAAASSAPHKHRVSRTVEVTQPQLDIQIVSLPQREAGQPIDYRITVRNTGTAPAQGVTVSAAMPTQGGKRRGPPPSGGEWVLKDRKIVWRIPRLDPGEPVEYQFLYDTSTVGRYLCSVEATSGEIRASKSTQTEVIGVADLDLKVSQTARVVDVGKSTYYDFTVKNHGTKEATKIQIRGETKNLKITNQYSENLSGQFRFIFDEEKAQPPYPGQFVFPEIPKLPPGESITLSIEVVGLHPGQASASVVLVHGEAGKDEGTPINQMIFTRVTDNTTAGH